MEIFTLKRGDTRPILEVVLRDPAPAGSAPGTVGPVHDLTGSTAWKLHVLLPTGTVFSRDMVVQGDPTGGVLRYTWASADWNADGLPARPSPQTLNMEYEVTGAAGARLTFPNDGYHTLQIVDDIGQA